MADDTITKLIKEHLVSPITSDIFNDLLANKTIKLHGSSISTGDAGDILRTYLHIDGISDFSLNIKIKILKVKTSMTGYQMTGSEFSMIIMVSYKVAAIKYIIGKEVQAATQIGILLDDKIQSPINLFNAFLSIASMWRKTSEPAELKLVISDLIPKPRRKHQGDRSKPKQSISFGDQLSAALDKLVDSNIHNFEPAEPEPAKSKISLSDSDWSN